MACSIVYIVDACKKMKCLWMNSGTENIYWGVLLVFAFFMHHCFYSPIFKKI